MSQNIEPYRHTAKKCLQGTNYFIDFYQREYVWNKTTVETLLNDIFDVFEQSYVSMENSELTPDLMDKHLSWYYMNVFITNKIDNKTYIVDGQQRLSTLTLICVKLYKLTTDSDLKSLLLSCICGKNWKNNVYCIANDKRKNVMDAILNDKNYDAQNKTEKNLLERYTDISRYIDNKNLKTKKLEAFIYFFLEKLVLVELCIDKQDDTAMVFEVINDRGEVLKPFEILKGKLIGVLDKSDTDRYSDIWDSSMHKISGKEDQFFSTYLKSRFVFKRNSEKEARINNAYHRYMFDDKDDSQILGFRKEDSDRISSIKKFISEELCYYSGLYAKIIKNEDTFLKYSNAIHGLDGQYQLILSACKLNDSEENKKISVIAKEYDRLYMLLRLNGVYDSNEFQSISYSLNEKLKNIPIADYRKTFNEAIKTKLKEAIGIELSVLDYNRFSQIGYGKITSTQLYYLFARIEDYICKSANQPMIGDVIDISTKHSSKKGYHIEHIFADNDESKSSFSSEEEFWNERNGIGALLILKGLDNISSGNEKYSDKLQTYSHGTLLAKTLVASFYHANPSFNNWNANLERKTGRKFIPYDKFNRSSMDERCRLLYEIVKIIWEVE